MKILLIEDDEHARYLLTYLLQHHGHDVMSAEDGITGSRLAREAQPGLILLDIQLPGLDGYSVAREIRQIPALQKVPIVAVSAHAMEGDRARAIGAGCNSYIEKPIDPERFVSDLRPFMYPPDAPEAG